MKQKIKIIAFIMSGFILVLTAFVVIASSLTDRIDTVYNTAFATFVFVIVAILLFMYDDIKKWFNEK